MMSYSSDSTDSERLRKSNESHKNVKGYPRRFKELWLYQFKPWLARDSTDKNIPFCKACRCRVICSTGHLQRHEKTKKHITNLQIYNQKRNRKFLSHEEIIKKNKETGKLNCSTIKAENEECGFENYLMNVGNENMEEDAGHIGTHESFEDQIIQEENHEIQISPRNKQLQESFSTQDKNTQTIKVPEEIIAKTIHLQIENDKNTTLSSVNGFVVPNTLGTKEKDPIDLFFDSVASSAKVLSPKLVAEMKLRVSQVLCDLELRNIAESEGTAVAGNSLNQVNTSSQEQITTSSF